MHGVLVYTYDARSMYTIQSTEILLNFNTYRYYRKLRHIFFSLIKLTTDPVGKSIRFLPGIPLFLNKISLYKVEVEINYACLGLLFSVMS